MTCNVNEAFEAFLVEDVILTLGTVRGALGWLGNSEDCPAAVRAEGFARVARQISALEDRARNLWQDLQLACQPPLEPALPAPDNLFDMGATPLPAARRAVFRTRRVRQ